MESNNKRDKVAELKKMKAFCLMLLLGCVVVSVVLEFLAPHPKHISLIFLKGAFEAAVVGAMADWYAVVALFRHPLGISSLPHTAIIPRRKDDIGDNLGKFIQNEFLDDALVLSKVKEFEPVEKLFIWIEKSEKNHLISNFIRKAIISIVADKSAKYLHEFTSKSLVKFIDQADASAILAQIISLLNDDKNRNELLDQLLNVVLSYMEDQHESWIEQAKEDGYWGLNIVGVPYVKKFIGAIYKRLEDVRGDEDHELRETIKSKVENYIYELQHDKKAIDAINKFKNDIMGNEKFLGFVNSIVTHAKEKLIADLNSESSYIVENIHEGVLALVKKYRVDDEFNQYLNGRLDDLVKWLLAHKNKIAEHLSEQVKKWTPDSISQKLELEIGKDLQWIRVSGTLVGGLVGGVFAALLHFVK